ncbi:MAG: toll/interleukin-1 receptor domain-containing protein, partial [Lachnospiraceae bacterium]|nr:toll/interleukin-1 receptor domain-containing protein [Lachnospiraceae bacterium]
MKEDRVPKIFISYSWSSDALVLELAQRLVSQGVDVVLDKWDLKEGQDKYAFMERCVNDPEITKVLIICDKAYAQKADDRSGGVGDETVIISSEIYGNMKQEKFIPVIAEKDEEGKPYTPTYIKTRIYIDLSNQDTYEMEYEKLLRNIYEKPQFIKPKLGKKPEWLDEEKTNFFPLKDLIRQIRGSNTDNKRKNCISRFQTAYIEILKEYFKKGSEPERIY